MKNKILYSLLGILVATVLVVTLVKNINTVKGSKHESGLVLKVMSDKQSYIQGESVKLSFELLNTSDKAISVAYRPDVSAGYLNVWIASEEHRFNRYNNTSWGTEEGGGIIIQPNQSFKSEAKVLWHSKPDVKNLNIESLKNSKEGAILSYYAFQDAGSYFVKGILTLPDGTRTKIESEPIQIVINEPLGDDLKVWNQIKDKGDIAYFMQQDETLTFQDEKAENLVKEIEQIIANYPNSLLVSQMQESLEKFKINEAKRKELRQRFRQNN